MPNNPPAPEKVLDGYVLVTEGVVQKGDWYYDFRNGWTKIRKHAWGTLLPHKNYPIVLRPPQPSERERELVEALREIIQKAPEKGPLWFGSEEMKAAHKALEREVKP